MTVEKEPINRFLDIFDIELDQFIGHQLSILSVDEISRVLRDNGVDVSTELIDHIFDVFTNIPDSAKNVSFRIPKERLVKIAQENKMKLTYPELIDNVLGWSTKTNIIGAGYLDGQFIKITEEIGELAGWIARNNPEMIKDTVGDIQVILINLTKMLGFDPTEIINKSIATLDLHHTEANAKQDSEMNMALILATLSFHILKIVDSIGQDGKLTSSPQKVSIYTMGGIWNTTLNLLGEISRRYNFTAKEALEHSWGVIKDREGIFYNRVFVKSADFTVDLLNKIIVDTAVSEEGRALAIKHRDAMVGLD